MSRGAVMDQPLAYISRRGLIIGYNEAFIKV
jgi:hypothetical protein